MDISSLNTAKLRSLINLTEVRDTLLAELQKVESAISSALSGQSAPAVKRGRKPGKVKVTAPVAATVSKAKASKRGGGKRGALKAQILAALKEAGAKGVSVKDLSNKLGVKNQNIHVWFATTGKTAGVQKIGPGVYRLK